MIGASVLSSGMRNYHFATAALSDGDFMGVFARIASVGCFSLAGLCALLQVHPAGPEGVSARAVQALVALSAVAVGSRWLWWSWPTYRHAVAFAVWLDVSLTVVALTTSDPVAALCVTMFLGLNGVFVAFLLGWRSLSVHLAFCGAVITAVVVFTALGDRSDLATLLLVLAPTITWVLVVSLCGGMLVERGRSAVRKTARSAHYDPLTGLRNRRGMYAAIHTALARATGPVTVTAAVCDIDKFKNLNDKKGHAAGDAALISMAQRLKSRAAGAELTARIGGDELVLVAITPTTTSTDTLIAGLLARLEPLTHLDTPAMALTASVGIAAHSTADRHFTIDDVLRHADAAMYDAKRSGGAACALYRDGVTEPTADTFRRSPRPSRLT